MSARTESTTLLLSGAAIALSAAVVLGKVQIATNGSLQMEPGAVVTITILGMLSPYAAIFLARAAIVYWIDRKLDQGGYDDAIRLCERYQSFVGDFLPKTTAYYWSGRIDECIALCREILNKPTTGSATAILTRVELGLALLAQDNVVEAIGQFLQAHVEGTEPTMSAQCGLAEAYVRAGNPERAILAAEASITQNTYIYQSFEPDQYARALAIKAWVHRELDELDEAAAAAARAEQYLKGASRANAAWTCFFLALASPDRVLRAGFFERGASFDPRGFWGQRCFLAATGKLPDWAKR